MTDKKPHAAEKPKRDSDAVLGEHGTISGQGREGGSLARKIGTEDEMKRAFERPAGSTRVTKSDEDA
ncbi:hypothetical protein [Amaricoccus tamworthensis]|uniref:hypothetical protein n=1 Tax=Amaricoccus tamworthensis TaxID=57002 RepID=UPI003C7A2054